MAWREFACRSGLWPGVVNMSRRKYNCCLVKFSNENSLLDFPAFVRIMGVNQGIPCAFFLGAGASVSSGVYSAYTCLWEWKREIVRTEEPQLARQLEELSLPSVRRRIQHWLDTQGVYPEEDAPDEYGFYAEECYPLGEARRQYFQNLVEGARPAPGYHLLGLLAADDVVASVWTPNFDRLTVRAAGDDLTVVEVGLDAPERVLRPRRRGELVHVALHGDFRYDALKNTAQEVRDQDATLRRALIERATDTDLIVVGYSGRDESIMSSLQEAYSRPGAGRLFWCGYGDAEPSPPVRKLLAEAGANDREAYYVPAPGFDELLGRLALGCLPEEEHQRVRELRASRSNHEHSAPFSVHEGRAVGVIKSNAFPVECPSEVLQFDWRYASQPGAWRRLRERVAGKDVVAGLLRGKVLALGTVDGVKDAFAGEIESQIERTPVDGRELGMQDGVVVGLFTEGLTRALAAERRLGTDGRKLLWIEDTYEKRRAYGVRCRVHEAVLVHLRRYGGKQHLVLMPTLHCTDEAGKELPREVEKELRRVELTKQYNAKFNEALNRWRKRLFGEGGRIAFPPDAASTFGFGIRSSPNFAKITGRKRRTVQVPSDVKRLVDVTGVEIDEPDLLFSNRRGDGNERDVNPVRGLLENRPYDYPLNTGVFGDEIRVGVVCPPAYAHALSGYLSDLRQDRRIDSKKEYLLDYPGFDRAFGISLNIPGPHNLAWAPCSEPNVNLDPERAGPELGRSILASIDALRSSTNPNVVLVFVPTAWARWERFDTEDQHFDLHDFVKAASVQRGVGTQFLRERTLDKAHQGEIFWWLALQCYVKAMRTPWLLADMDPDLAFIGLGFSLDPAASRGRQVLMGCSHVYNSEGLGLSYKLGKLESSVKRRGNYFLSREDARRMAENAVQLFCESGRRMPDRVVVHKNGPIADEERRGLLEGLGDTSSVDMLEITVDPALRYVASWITGNRIKEDGYPVRRGTTIALDGQRALAWVHGTVDAVEGQRRYYQGKSRIPAPLMLRRHHGASSLAVLAEQILGLSKMDWNSLDLYTKVPTTLRSSNQIARIGGLLDRLGSNSYDYRLFI